MSELLKGVQIIAERLENFPDEFIKWKSYIQWSIHDAESPLEDHEKAFLLDVYKKAKRTQYNADVLQRLQDDIRLSNPAYGFGRAQIKAEGQNIGYGTLINDNNS